MGARRAARAIILAIGAALSAPGCLAPPPTPLSADLVESDPALRAALGSTVFLIRLKEAGPDGEGTGAVSGGVHLGGGAVLTAAHSVPGRLLSGELDRATIYAQRGFHEARLEHSGADLRGRSDPEEARIPSADDWAILRLGGPIGARDAERWGVPVEGEKVYIVGFPIMHMREGWLDGFAWTPPEAPAWETPEPVVIEGLARAVSESGFRIRVEGGLTARHRGTSGAGAFALRGGRPVLVGVVNKARMRGDFFSAALVPGPARERLGPCAGWDDP